MPADPDKRVTAQDVRDHALSMAVATLKQLDVIMRATYEGGGAVSAQVTAGKLILEAARLIGANVAELPASSTQTLGRVLYLDRDKAEAEAEKRIAARFAARKAGG